MFNSVYIFHFRSLVKHVCCTWYLKMFVCACDAAVYAFFYKWREVKMIWIEFVLFACAINGLHSSCTLLQFAQTLLTKLRNDEILNIWKSCIALIFVFFFVFAKFCLFFFFHSIFIYNKLRIATAFPCTTCIYPMAHQERKELFHSPLIIMIFVSFSLTFIQHLVLPCVFNFFLYFNKKYYSERGFLFSI